MHTNLYRAWAALLLLWMSSCTTGKDVSAPAPKAFAINQDSEKETLISAVSYSGVTYRVRELENVEKADLTFWRESLEFQLKNAGYIFKSRKKIMASGTKGVMLNFIAPLSTTDYNFSVALFVREDKIYVAEAAGEVRAFKPLRKEIAKAVTEMTFN